MNSLKNTLHKLLECTDFCLLMCTDYTWAAFNNVQESVCLSPLLKNESISVGALEEAPSFFFFPSLTQTGRKMRWNSKHKAWLQTKKKINFKIVL